MGAMPDTAPAGERLPLSALVSQLLVAFTIEFDNEFEHRMPHRTTRHGPNTHGMTEHGATPGAGRAPWLVSMAMWVHCMRHVPEHGIPAGDLARRSQLSRKSAQGLVKRLSQWWGYLTVAPDPADGRVKQPPSAWLVRPTAAGRQAQRVWEPLTAEIEDRWRERFGAAAIAELRASLGAIAGQLDVVLPDYLPVGEPRLDKGPAPQEVATLPLSALMSHVLLAFALDFDRESDLSLGIYTADGVSRLAVSANVLRVLGDQPARAAGVPARTGVAKMAVDNWLGSLEEHRYLASGRDPAGSRFRVATLTSRGLHARDVYHRWASTVEDRWAQRFSAQPVRELRNSAGRLVTAPGDSSPLWRGIEPYPGGWRAQVPRPQALPHYPVVSHRGGFPDGS
jgi:DNA-binding MarR family transcriptional regulator